MTDWRVPNAAQEADRGGVAKLKPPPQGKQIDYHDMHMPGLVCE